MATNALNRLEPVYYIVEIDGAVDNESPEIWAAANSNAFPATLAQSLAIEQTNMRYEAVIRSVSEDIQPLQTSAIAVLGRSEDDPATSIQFTLVYDRPEFLYTEDEDNPGIFLTGVDAVTRYVARGLVRDEIMNRQIYDAESPKNEPQILKVTAEKLYDTVFLAEDSGDIIVTKVPNLID